MRAGGTLSKIRALLQLLRSFLSTLVCPWIGRTGRRKTLQTPLTRLRTSVRTTKWQRLEAWQQLGRSPKRPRTGSEEDSLDVAVLLDRAAGRFSACMDTKDDSMMDRFEKRIDERIDSKLGPVVDRLTALEKTNSSTRSGPSSTSDNGGSAGYNGGSGSASPAVFAPSYLKIKGWCRFRDRNTHGLTEAQAKLRQGIGPDLDSLIARVGALRFRNTKIICYLKTPILSSCKQIREAMRRTTTKTHRIHTQHAPQHTKHTSRCTHHNTRHRHAAHKHAP